ncbi:hypothetical protein SAMN06296036_113118 [Pseudobacteriovorax antillogorgiicola]|uniref:Uncharacterized protein n=1 Tax=Pseudobacteriovorax antillogorgiicola TaxID=1513793 RepID=A0A1Y6C4U2_9BACT|nr:hypothetical protein SAMN06296036_113118 [Pseudobacteriovorax antillogorgiicola]
MFLSGLLGRERGYIAFTRARVFLSGLLGRER